MMGIKLYSVGISLFVVAAALTDMPVDAQGYRCRDSTTSSEATICRDPVLARLDRDLNDAYIRAIARNSGAQQEHIRRSQRWWISVRNHCRINISCLEASYRARIMQLREARP